MVVRVALITCEVKHSIWNATGGAHFRVNSIDNSTFEVNVSVRYIKGCILKSFKKNTTDHNFLLPIIV